MLALLPLLTFGPGLRLHLDVPSQVQSGKEVVATIWAENKGDKPIVCVIPSGPNAHLGVIWKSSLTKNGKEFIRDESGPFMGQWMRNPEVGTEPFLTLRPGQRAELYKEKFKVYFTKGFKPYYIPEFAKAPRAPLPAGEYTLSFRYGFDRTFKEVRSKTGKWSPNADYLTKPARALYNRTWTGAIDVSESFKVTTE